MSIYNIRIHQITEYLYIKDRFINFNSIQHLYSFLISFSLALNLILTVFFSNPLIMVNQYFK